MSTMREREHDLRMLGVRETNSLSDRGFESVGEWQAHLATIEETVDWTDPRLKEVTVLRLLSDPGFPVWDVSYCHGVTKDGKNVRVSLPFCQLPKRGMIRAIVEAAKADKVYAKGLGILDNISTLQ